MGRADDLLHIRLREPEIRVAIGVGQRLKDGKSSKARTNGDQRPRCDSLAASSVEDLYDEIDNDEVLGQRARLLNGYASVYGPNGRGVSAGESAVRGIS